ncbi:putative zinc finger domain protein, LSD1 subclass [Clostridium argentinense CDC 2741]|uniref:Putative zinc finger domain protein, LSD1 subclass n=1 Tax=Clostridium argentinense CDC 2741 TaxID=1418104 RepID=A0A0C1TZA2_9CLOT|nr:hypothetical protein [Clostridium argentinense]ARC83345.1 hypothetical protein RSJ17_01660 [Clostridium argentinense]KIE45964.1 putative zinc finger domain protein, LSD1 subclass [Clostridium argentinense CDC 2741]NFF39213.1 hypothetical protein [Clostridium argentinense]NFP49625.1 hypothetical protein [Clostridium argentinense]NFP72328.1 hypothetical protein [Clostridium argentinense]
MNSQIDDEVKSKKDTDKFTCSGCGANMIYDPNIKMLTCPYCSNNKKIEVEGGNIEEHDFYSTVDKQDTDWGAETRVIHCDSCGAETILEKNNTAQFCAFCGSSHIVKREESNIVPESLIPFKIGDKEAKIKFSQWIGKHFFAPRALKYGHQSDKLKGIYIPFWTYDTETYSTYTAEAGTYYYVTVTYYENENGKQVAKTRQERRTRWEYTNGNYNKFFDDVLINASTQLDGNLMDKIKPYDLKELVHYNPEFISGFYAERYGINHVTGFNSAKEHINDIIYSGVVNKINADEVRNVNIKTSFEDVKFKHILLPIWISSYSFKNKVYKYYINGQTGEIQGETPISGWKIFFTIALIVAIIFIIYKLMQ